MPAECRFDGVRFDSYALGGCSRALLAVQSAPKLHIRGLLPPAVDGY
jgi:hypothetical protein